MLQGDTGCGGGIGIMGQQGSQHSIPVGDTGTCGAGTAGDIGPRGMDYRRIWFRWSLYRRICKCMCDRANVDTWIHNYNYDYVKFGIFNPIEIIIQSTDSGNCRIYNAAEHAIQITIDPIDPNCFDKLWKFIKKL